MNHLPIHARRTTRASSAGILTAAVFASLLSAPLAAQGGFGTRLPINASGASPLPSAGTRITPIGVDTSRTSVVFPATDAFGTELWRSDGTIAGTFRITDANPVGSSVATDGRDVLAFNQGLTDVILFRATVGGTTQIWQTDGTQGAESARTAIPGPALAGTTGEMVLDSIGRVWFGADDGVNGDELWLLPPTGAAIRVSTTTMTSSIRDLRVMDTGTQPVVLFTGFDGAGAELWASNGTVTQRVVNLLPGPTGGGTLINSDFAGIYLFRGVDAFGSTLYSIDPMDAVAVPPVPPTRVGGPMGERLSDPSEVVTCAGQGFFTAQDTSGQRNLYQLQNGGMLNSLLIPTPPFPGNLVCVDDILYASGDDGVIGDELWRAGVPVTDINPGSLGSSIAQITPCGSGGVLFRASDSTAPTLWFSNGTTTTQLQVPAEGINPRSITRSGRTVFWVADFQGRTEVFAGDLQGTGDFLMEPFGMGSIASQGPASLQRIPQSGEPQAGGILLMNVLNAAGAPINQVVDVHFMGPTLPVDIAIPGTGSPCNFYASNSLFNVPTFADGLFFLSIPASANLLGARLIAQGIYAEANGPGNCLVPGVAVTSPIDIVFN